MNITVESCDNGRLLLNKSYVSLLLENGLDSAESLWSLGSTPVKNRLRERGTERAELLASDGSTVEVYIKRYLPPPVSEYIKNLFSAKSLIRVGALHEWNALLAFHSADLQTMMPLAVASLGDGRSCNLTLGIMNYTRASDWFAKFADISSLNVAERLRRWRMIRSIGELAGKMHAAGFGHQDFYLVHLFIEEGEGDRLNVIDLQRLVFPDGFARRWRIKDLGQLLYSARGLYSRTDLLRFWIAYTEHAGSELFRDSRLISAVFSKADQISRRGKRRSQRSA